MMLTTPFNAPKGTRWQLWIPTLWFLFFGLPGLGIYLTYWAIRRARMTHRPPRVLPPGSARLALTDR